MPRRFGFDSAWIAQHHFHEHEGGLPSPFVFLAYVAARTARIRLGTGIVTLPLENAVRVAEDAAVLDLLSGGRLEVGVGTGGNLTAFAAFGLDSNDRSAIFARQLDAGARGVGGPRTARRRHALSLKPALVDRIWQATFSVSGGARAGAAGDGLMLSRTQPRRRARTRRRALRHPEPDHRRLSRGAAARARVPRILASRTVFVADDPQGGDAPGRDRPAPLGRALRRVGQVGLATAPARSTLDELIAAYRRPCRHRPTT